MAQADPREVVVEGGGKGFRVRKAIILASDGEILRERIIHAKIYDDQYYRLHANFTRNIELLCYSFLLCISFCERQALALDRASLIKFSYLCRG